MKIPRMFFWLIFKWKFVNIHIGEILTFYKDRTQKEIKVKCIIKLVKNKKPKWINSKRFEQILEINCKKTKVVANAKFNIALRVRHAW